MASIDDRLQLAGTVSGLAPDTAEVRRAFGTRKTMERDGEFTGRLSTQVYASDTLVVKVRSEHAFARSQGERWVAARIERERALGIYPPGKAWYLLAAGTQVLAVNAAPRLLSLRHWRASDAAALQRTWTGVAERYLDAREHGYRLDEDLTNFGVGADGRVCYLDDDLYPWSGFGPLAAFLDRTFCRRGDPDEARGVGQAIAMACIARLGPAGSIGLLHEVEAIAAVNDAHAGRLAALAAGLRPPREKPVAAPRQQAPIGLLADVHANLPALQQALSVLRAAGITRFLVLGDSVGYGPFPAECIELLAGLDAVVIRGNHDEAVAGETLPTPFSHDARWVVEWTRNRLSKAHRDWLGALPLRHADGDWMAVHGAPGDPRAFSTYVYQMTSVEQLDCLQGLQHRMCFHGHSHLAGAYLRDGRGDRFCGDGTIDLAGVRQALICPGSVGQPRGGASGCQFGVFDPAAGVVRLASAGYPTEDLIEAMRRNGFPPGLLGRIADPR
ncbi:metallophosphoesterase family protein [Dokdonella koreensis]|uniref:Calcineurin-like phosphoesterase domain-containing protein n=1 Tax=Dokdonella koreensis DS-123 TaxID=1300342 RepID=A0A160DTC2_9GAMM|nr:metallophosphoesterase family protein [Dokdonella koreensis]ANB16823.1 Hypothetical protein I596_787 [Dokdonella koreensis DS-123]